MKFWTKFLTWHHALSIALGLGLLVLVIEINTWRLGFQAIWYVSTHFQAACLLIGLGLLVWGISGASVPKSWYVSPQLRHELAILALIMLIGLGLRVIGAGETVRVLVDELQPISESLQLTDRPDTKLLHQKTLNVSPYSWFFAYLRELGIDLFGGSLASLRLFSAIVGTLSIPAIYLLARGLSQRQVALIAAMLFATYPPHLHYSRIAIINIMDAFIGIWALACLVYALKTKHPLWFTLAGLCLGLTQYFFEGARLFFIPLVGLWLLTGALFWRDQLRGSGHGLLRMMLMTVLTAAPLYITWSVFDAPLTGRLSASSQPLEYWFQVLFAPFSTDWLRIQAAQMARAFAIYVVLPDQSVFYGGQTALILPILVPFFALGALYALWRSTTPLSLIALWLISTSVANGLLMINSASSPHFLVAFPPLVWTCAIGISLCADALAARWRIAPRLKMIALGVTVIVLAAGQVYYYFVPHLAFYNAQFRLVRPYPDVEDALLRAITLPPDTNIHIIVPHDPTLPPNAFIDPGPEYIRNFYRFLGGKPHLVRHISQAEFTHAYLETLDPQQTQAFFIPVGDERSLFLASRYFELRSPRYTTYADVPYEKQLVLYLSR